jgi:preprotein translocase subunit SecA
MASTHEDKIWTDEARKLEGIRRDVEEARGEGLSVLVVAHFENVLSSVSKRLRECSIEFKTYASGDSSALCAGAGGGAAVSVWVVLASHLLTSGYAVTPKAGEVSLRVLVAEHHPLLAKDEALLAALLRLPCRSRVTFHAALNDALLARVVGEGTMNLLKMLGHTDEECISHPVLSRAIRGVQEKIARRARGDLPTASAEDWFEYNTGSST